MPTHKAKQVCETCEFYITSWDDPPQIIAGKVFLEDGKLRFWAKKGYEIFMKNVRREQTFANSKHFDSIRDPEGWFRSLPYHYDGSMVRAGIVKISDKKKGSLPRQGGRHGTRSIKGRKDK
jgi:hypothetical protein